jgi:hypothetical protein
MKLPCRGIFSGLTIDTCSVASGEALKAWRGRPEVLQGAGGVGLDLVMLWAALCFLGSAGHGDLTQCFDFPLP